MPRCWPYMLRINHIQSRSAQQSRLPRPTRLLFPVIELATIDNGGNRARDDELNVLSSLFCPTEHRSLSVDRLVREHIALLTRTPTSPCIYVALFLHLPSLRRRLVHSFRSPCRGLPQHPPGRATPPLSLILPFYNTRIQDSTRNTADGYRAAVRPDPTQSMWLRDFRA